MFVELKQDGTKATAYLISYDDPKYYNALNEVPPIAFNRDTISKMPHRGPLVLAVLPIFEEDTLKYTFLRGVLNYADGQLLLQGYDDSSSSLRVKLKNFKRHNQRLLAQSYLQGVSESFPVLAASDKKLSINWVGLDTAHVSKSAMYLSQVCLANVRNTYAVLTLLLKEELYPVEPSDWVIPRWSCQNLFWLFCPGPRPPNLQTWVESIDKEEEFPFFDIGPATEGFYLVSLELKSETKGSLDSIDFKHIDKMDVSIERGDTGTGTSLDGKNFSQRARVCCALQLALMEKKKGLWTSVAWGAHSDEQRLRLLPFSADCDIRRFGYVRTQELDETRLKEYEIAAEPWMEDVYKLVAADAHEVLAHVDAAFQSV